MMTIGSDAMSTPTSKAIPDTHKSNEESCGNLPPVPTEMKDNISGTCPSSAKLLQPHNHCNSVNDVETNLSFFSKEQHCALKSSDAIGSKSGEVHLSEASHCNGVHDHESLEDARICSDGICSGSSEACCGQVQENELIGNGVKHETSTKYEVSLIADTVQKIHISGDEDGLSHKFKLADTDSQFPVCDNRQQLLESDVVVPLQNCDDDKKLAPSCSVGSEPVDSLSVVMEPVKREEPVCLPGGDEHSKDAIVKVSVETGKSISSFSANAMDDVTEGANESATVEGIQYVVYQSEHQMPDIMRLITHDLSEPYSIYTYRYFIHNWPHLCFLAVDNGKCVGAIVSKLDMHKKIIRRGYIAMLAVAQDYRKRGIGSQLVVRAIRGMISSGCDEVVLETEISNTAALHLYENLGFVRDKRLFRYYLNGVDALRLKLWLR